MKEFIRKNPLIVASVALPLILIVVFGLAGFVPRLLVDPPQHDLILMERDGSVDNLREHGYSVTVQDDRVFARVNTNPEQPVRKARRNAERRAKIFLG